MSSIFWGQVPNQTEPNQLLNFSFRCIQTLAFALSPFGCLAGHFYAFLISVYSACRLHFLAGPHNLQLNSPGKLPSQLPFFEM